MTSTSRHLLTIPVEVRSQILSYLTHEVESRWRWNYWPLGGNAAIATIHLQAVPSLNVMLACTRLYEESLASCNMNRLSVEIDLALDNRCTYITESARDQAVNGDILPRIVRATIHVAAEARSQSLYDHIWFNISALSKALAAQSPNLTMVRVIAMDITDTQDIQNHQTKVSAGFDFFGASSKSPYEELAGLPLHEQAVGSSCEAAARDGLRLEGDCAKSMSTVEERGREGIFVWTYRMTAH